MLAGFVLGAFILAVFIVLVLNAKQTPLPPSPSVPLIERPRDERRDA